MDETGENENDDSPSEDDEKEYEVFYDYKEIRETR